MKKSKKSEKESHIEPETHEKLIGIYVQNHKYDYQDIIFIGEIKFDSIKKITDWDDSIGEYVENRLPYLKKYDKYFVNNLLDKETINIDTIRKKEFQCSQLTVGNSDKYNLNIKSEFSFCSSNKNFKNIKSNAVNDINSKSLDIIRNKLRKALEDDGVNIISGYDSNFQTRYKDVYLDVLQSTDLDNDGIIVYIIKGIIVEDRFTKNSVILAFNITEDYIKDVGIIETCSNGYNLIGVTDLNKNEKFELIFQGVGYESIGFEIYEITSNGFKQILYTVPNGC